jgi:hypothetical protein
MRHKHTHTQTIFCEKYLMRETSEEEKKLARKDGKNHSIRLFSSKNMMKK